MNKVSISKDGFSVTRVDPEHVDAVLPFAIPMLEKSLPYIAEFESIEQMIDIMRQGARPWQLWVADDGKKPVGAFISTIEKAGDEIVFVFEVLAAGGTSDWIMILMEPFEKYVAWAYNVTSTRIIGRPGWEKFLKGSGYEVQAFITGKKLAPKVLPSSGPDRKQIQNV